MAHVQEYQLIQRTAGKGDRIISEYIPWTELKDAAQSIWEYNHYEQLLYRPYGAPYYMNYELENLQQPEPLVKYDMKIKRYPGKLHWKAGKYFVIEVYVEIHGQRHVAEITEKLFRGDSESSQFYAALFQLCNRYHINYWAIVEEHRLNPKPTRRYAAQRQKWLDEWKPKTTPAQERAEVVEFLEIEPLWNVG